MITEEQIKYLLIYMAIYVVISIFCMILCLIIAEKKNRNMVFWSLLGFVGGIIPLIVLAFLKRLQPKIENPRFYHY